jgi:hypothetical protein
MSDAGLKFDMNGETNVEDVEGRIKKSTNSIEKQIEGIGNKFKTAFKDIFLSFLGPMALLHLALNYITKAIDERNAKIKEAQEAAVKGENPYISEETSNMARGLADRKKDREEKQQAVLSREKNTFDFLEESAENRDKVMAKLGVKGFIKYGLASYGYASKQADVQKAAEEVDKENALNNPPTPYANKDFKSPEGFSNVVGIGASPVLEAMTQQLEQQKMQTYLLQQIANGSGGANPPDFTKDGGMRSAPYGI